MFRPRARETVRTVSARPLLALAALAVVALASWLVVRELAVTATPGDVPPIRIAPGAVDAPPAERRRPPRKRAGDDRERLYRTDKVLD